jgi:hypothetical protein
LQEGQSRRRPTGGRGECATKQVRGLSRPVRVCGLANTSAGRQGWYLEQSGERPSGLFYETLHFSKKIFGFAEKKVQKLKRGASRLKKG